MQPELSACVCGVTIHAIVKSRWETGAYGDVHFVMPEATWTSMPRPEPDPSAMPTFGLPDPMRALLSIPIVRDDSMPAGSWKLVTNSTKDVRHEGGSAQ
jgi:hypothetical protein